jgi:transcriptional regulator with XRE-family HTH domain
MANRLREFRKNQGMTQMQIADVLRCQQTLVSQYERGVHTPSLHNAIRLARALGTTVEELFGGEVDG